MDWWSIPLRMVGWLVMLFFVSWLARAITRRIPPGRARAILATPHQHWKRPWLGPVLLLVVWILLMIGVGLSNPLRH
jgi:hypothetical protein